MILQCSPFITLCLGSIGIDHAISEFDHTISEYRDNFTKEFGGGRVGNVHGHFPIIPW